MAQVKWTVKADRLFDQYVFNAFLEFGRKTHVWNDTIKTRTKPVE